jgi:urease accessory protein
MSVLEKKKLGNGWKAQLNLGFSKSHSRTILDYRKHCGPLQVQKPFYPESKGVNHTYILHPPGGVVGGDHLNISVDVASNAHALITTPAAGKFYRSAGPIARQEQSIKVASKGTLEWFPSENIIFSGAQIQIKTRIELACDSDFIAWEIFCLGQPVSGKYFDRGELDQRFEIWRDGSPLRIERLKIKGGGPTLGAKWGLQGFPVVGNMVCVTDQKDLLVSLKECSDAPVQGDQFSVTYTDGVILCRYLGNSTERAKHYFIRLWKKLRPSVMNCEAVEPRIWKT